MPTLIVDGMSVFRTVAGNAAHLDRGYTFSFFTQLTAAIRRFEAAPVMVCWEGGYGGRDKVHPEYKANRRRTPDLIRDERAETQRLLTMLGVDQYVAPGYEGDDVVAFLANTLPTECVILSNDKDVLQLVRPNVSVFQKVKLENGKMERRRITDRNFYDMTGWPSPSVYLLGHLALGDAVDGVPKLPGVGAPLIQLYHQGIEIAPAKQKKLEEFYAGSELYLKNKKLIDLTGIRELPVVVTKGELAPRTALNFLEELRFASIVKKFPEWFHIYERATSADVPTIPEFL